MIASESCPQLSVYGSEHRAYQDTCHRESVSDALGYCDDVGPDAAKLMGKESSGAAVSALNLIQNQDCSGRSTVFAKCLYEFCGGNLYAAHTLYAFDNHRTNIAFVQFALHTLDVVQREISDMSVTVDRSDDGGIVCSLYRQ